MLAHLSSDIFYCILDHSDDKTTLKSCALVSSLFRSPSQKRLFSSITLQIRNQTRNEPTGLPSIYKFFNILTANPRLAAYVCELRLWLPIAVRGMPSTYMVDEVRNAKTYGILSMLHGLRSFTIRAHRVFGISELNAWDLYSESLRADVIRLLQANVLENLSVSHISGFPLQAIRQCVSLTNLELKWCHLDIALSGEPAPQLTDSEAIGQVHTGNKHCELKNLTLSPPDYLPSYVEALSSDKSHFFRIQNLTIDGEIYGTKQRDLCQTALTSFKGSLENIRFCVFANASTPLFLDLSFVRCLRSVTATFLGPPAALLLWAEIFVNSAIPQGLENLTLDLGLERPTAAEWRLLDRALFSKAHVLKDARITLIYDSSPLRLARPGQSTHTDIPLLMERGNIELRLRKRLEYRSR